MASPAARTRHLRRAVVAALLVVATTGTRATFVLTSQFDPELPLGSSFGTVDMQARGIGSECLENLSEFALAFGALKGTPE